jgi:hypothetical protein
MPMPGDMHSGMGKVFQNAQETGRGSEAEDFALQKGVLFCKGNFLFLL